MLQGRRRDPSRSSHWTAPRSTAVSPCGVAAGGGGWLNRRWELEGDTEKGTEQRGGEGIASAQRAAATSTTRAHHTLSGCRIRSPFGQPTGAGNERNGCRPGRAGEAAKARWAGDAHAAGCSPSGGCPRCFRPLDRREANSSLLISRLIALGL